MGETVWSDVASTESFAREWLEFEGRDYIWLATIHWETARVEHFSPWTPKFGKTLPHGVRVVVQVTSHGYAQGLSEIPAEFQDRFDDYDARDELRLKLGCWYANGTCNHPDRPIARPEAGTGCPFSPRT